MTEETEQKMLGLEDIREQIDETDRAILELLAQRSQLVSCVAEVKAQSGDSRILRPAREIVQMRHFLTWFKERGLAMPVSGFSAIWREIIAASVSQQTPLKVMHMSDTLTTARERFGNAADYVEVNHPDDALGKLDAHANRIAVLPFKNSDWWQSLPEGMKIFGALPYLSPLSKGDVQSLCVGCIAIEPSGEDVTLLSCPKEDGPENDSADHLAENKDAHILASSDTHHLIMVDGFMNTDRIGDVVGSFGSLEIMDALLVGEKS